MNKLENFVKKHSLARKSTVALEDIRDKFPTQAVWLLETACDRETQRPTHGIILKKGEPVLMNGVFKLDKATDPEGVAMQLVNATKKARKRQNNIPAELPKD